ncbi:hypothetical protein HPP92_020566 [Vanilla planifolia]|uniref:Oligopeptide transporter 5 n=1 Tax=Vanilla planifolia TaxID=51239 RepID=A0A835UK02_VANPL|nr:hypothetical protein HPP92_020566 [Vanilla planifolia]
MVDPFDNPNLPVLTVRTWLLGVVSCVLLSFANMFFALRANQLSIGTVCLQIITLPAGRLLAATLPKKDMRLPLTQWSISLNPGPFSIKEHCLITIFAGAGAGCPYAIHILTIVKAFYHRDIHPMAAFMLAQTSQLLGYGWAGIYRKYLVDSPYMWWPGNLVQVALLKALHLKEHRKRGTLTRLQFFLIVFITSLAYYTIPGFLFPSLSCISVLCLIFKKSITIQQIGSGLQGLGIGSLSLDWSTIVGFLGSPLATPATTIFNMMFSYLLGIYVLIPLGYWTNTYNAKRFPIMSSDVFDDSGRSYNTSQIISDGSFTLDAYAIRSYSNINFSIKLVLTYGLGFASLTASIMHVALYYGKDIWMAWNKSKECAEESVQDVHSRLMRNYESVPLCWFHILLVVLIALSIYTCMGFHRQLQLPVWGVLLACGISFFLTLPIGVIMATTNQAPQLTVFTEYVIGLMSPGKPLANLTFKAYGIVSMTQALTLLSDLNLGNYMKIPPKSMFITQLVGTIISTSVYFSTTWMLLESVKNICDTTNLPPNSPWTCPGDNVFYTASIVWGLVGTKNMFGKLGRYSNLNYFFIVGALLPIPFWLLNKVYPDIKWLKYMHVPLIVSGVSGISSAHSVNYIMWGTTGILFNYFIYKKYNKWWARHTYICSAALDAGVAFMGIILFSALQAHNIGGIDWWGGIVGDYCKLASCPTDPRVEAPGCPIIS